MQAERLAAIGRMAGHVTHEVRNPLSSIGLNTELLEEELAALNAGDEAKQLCSAIGREVDRLTAITEEYLTFARLPTPRLAAGSGGGSSGVVPGGRGFGPGCTCAGPTGGGVAGPGF